MFDDLLKKSLNEWFTFMYLNCFMNEWFNDNYIFFTSHLSQPSGVAR